MSAVVTGVASAIDDNRYVLFSLSGETYAVPVSTVREVVNTPTLTPVPHAPPCIEGIMNLRGNVVPVINLGRRLGVEAQGGAAGCTVVVEWENEVVGLLVGEVVAVIPLPDYQSEGIRAGSAAEDFVLGVARLRDEGLVLMLDLLKILQRVREG